MNAIRIVKRLDHPVEGLPELDSMVGKRVEIIVLAEPDTPRPQSKRAGFAKGQIWVSPDFDDPLDDFLEYM